MRVILGLHLESTFELVPIHLLDSLDALQAYYLRWDLVRVTNRLALSLSSVCLHLHHLLWIESLLLQAAG